MANYIVSDTNLTAVANAIRTKGGTSEQLEFPDDFVSAIGDIQTGGGVTVEALSVTENGTYTAPMGKAYSPVTVNVSGGGTDTLAALESNTLTSWTSTATKIQDSLFCGKTALISASYPNATVAGSNCFSGCANLTTVYVPKLTSLESSCFYNCRNLTTINVPRLTSLGTSCFSNCEELVSLDFPVLGRIPSSAFSGSTLTTLILRKSGSICTLANKNAFNNTPFASSGTGGTLYVPQDLIASYQSANNWSTILGYANNQIKAIEGSIYE